VVVRLLLLIALLSGCAQSLTKPIEFAPYVRPNVPTLKTVIGPYAVATEGKEAPITGVVLTEAQMDAVYEYVATVLVLLNDSEGYASDVMWQCRVKDEAMIATLQQARAAQAEALGVGFLGGLGACGAGIGAAALGGLSP